MNKLTLSTGTKVVIRSGKDASSKRGSKESFSPIHKRHMLVKFTTISVANCKLTVPTLLYEFTWSKIQAPH